MVSVTMWEDPCNVLKPHYRFESCSYYKNKIMTKEKYLEILGKGTKFTEKAGKTLRYTKKEIKATNCNEIFITLKNKKKEIELLISEFECILKEAK